ncbi:MAG: ABC transporter permease [Lachnospiraceae bacterium]
MGQLTEYIKMALQNIRGNKGRSFLTMLGIIIGISSVITIMSVGDGFKAQMNNELVSLAGGQIYVYVNDEGSVRQEWLTPDDIEMLEDKMDTIMGVTPELSDTGTVITQKGEYDVSIRGGTKVLQSISDYTLTSGRYFDESDVSTGNKVCVILKEDARQIFGTEDVLGMDIEVTAYGTPVDLTIIGLVEAKNASGMISMMNGGSEDYQITMQIPYTVMSAWAAWDVEDFGQMMIKIGANADSKAVAEESLKLLNASHHAEDKSLFSIQDFNDTMSQVNSTMGTITGFVALVAAISLLVGGIGVMNIMLVSVTERTREIGIRKALGAKTTSVMLQFLAESAIIAGIGGVIGIAFGLLISQLVCSALGFDAGIKISTILFATLFSSGIGIFFGIYPARKAANLSPIEALRRS